MFEGGHCGDDAGGERGSCHDSNEWKESKDSADDAAGELGSTASPGSGVVSFTLLLLIVEVDGVRSLRAGAVAARLDANAASRVRLTCSCPDPSNAPPTASISSGASRIGLWIASGEASGPLPSAEVLLSEPLMGESRASAGLWLSGSTFALMASSARLLSVPDVSERHLVMVSS